MSINNQTVCVTGATGFVASALIKQLLAKGNIVHGTVRSLSQKNKYQFLYDLSNAHTHLKLFEADLVKDGSFDSPVEGCSIVYHTASPFFLAEPKDALKELVEPAVNGTLSVLKSSAKSNSVKRVVVTSSGAAIYEPSALCNPYTEENWNDVASLTRKPYCFSKAEAERAAWRFMRENEASISFDLIVVNPPMIIGPILQDVNLNPQLNQSSLMVLDLIRKVKNGEEIDVNGFGVVDVRDVAAIHILLGESQDARVPNNRFIACNSSYSYPEMIRLLQSALPQEFSGVPELKVKGDEEDGKKNKTPQLINTKLKNIFPSFQYIDATTTFVDSYKSLKELNLL